MRNPRGGCGRRSFPAARWWAAGASSLVLGLAVAACERPGSASAQESLTAEQNQTLLSVLAQAPAQGFQPSAFPTAGIEKALKSDDPQARAAAEGRLVAEAEAYAKAEHGLSIPRRAMDASWGMRPGAYDPVADLHDALAGNTLSAWAASLPPPEPGYQALQRAYGRYLALAQTGWPMVPPGPPLKAGAAGPRVQALRARLAAEDAALKDQDPNAPFDEALRQAVARAQARYGLKTTGVLDRPTLASLNVPAEARAAQIRANLERWRWVPRDQPATRIEVNSSGGTFDFYQNGQSVLHMLVVAGKPGDETPILASRIHSVVLNPQWNVPESIAGKELFPKEQQHPGYFAEHGFVVNDGKIVQQPGPENALGRVKFLFDNSYGVYLHDTPSRAAFNQSQRSASHGCVRLEKALDLASLVLSQDSDWTPERMDAALAGQDSVTIRLKQAIPVEIFYWTAFAGPDGQVSFREDVYGWDAETLRQLDAGASSRA